ncbi:hypothetical protein EDB81DRAFT_933482 [Dactylonectria macrodidyma]|uniref:Uncharacterized protein n=1 Tax=Dactylonectria macrodidyma TaxID=307937 RepID=A0A9P9EZE2_9HYPO|nr:hypothetical protein EDB81DRAFT_933482 [Dactylonectria macrodidyma]
MEPDHNLIPREDDSQHYSAVSDTVVSELLRDREEVPVEYVNELWRRMDRLMLEMDNRLAEAEEGVTAFKGSFDAFREKNKKEKTGLQEEVQRLREALNMKNEEEEDSSEAEAEKPYSRLEGEIRELQVKNESLREMNGFIGSKLKNKELEVNELNLKVQDLEFWQKKWQTRYEDTECHLERERQEKKAMREKMKVTEDEVERLTRGIHGVLAKMAEGVPSASRSGQEPGLQEALINYSDGENPPHVPEWLSPKDLVGEDRTLETLDMLKDELESVNAKLGLIREERDTLETAHQALHTELQTARSSWSIFIKAIAEASDMENELSKDTRLLIKKMYEDLADLERKFLMMWPGAQASVRHGQLKRDMLTKAALDKAQLSLQHELEQAVELQNSLIQQEQEYARRLGRMDIIVMGQEALEEAAGIADYSFSRHEMDGIRWDQPPPKIDWAASEPLDWSDTSADRGMEGVSGHAHLEENAGELKSDTDESEEEMFW